MTLGVPMGSIFFGWAHLVYAPALRLTAKTTKFGMVAQTGLRGRVYGDSNVPYSTCGSQLSHIFRDPLCKSILFDLQ